MASEQYKLFRMLPCKSHYEVSGGVGWPVREFLIQDDAVSARDLANDAYNAGLASRDDEVERLRDVEKAARSLIERMDELIQSDQHRSAGGCHIAECVPEEDSPTWIREACTLRHALSPFAQPGGEGGRP